MIRIRKTTTLAEKENIHQKCWNAKSKKSNENDMEDGEEPQRN